MPAINLTVTEEQNEARKKLKATWRDVISAGLAALGKTSLDSPSKKAPSLDPAIEDNLKLAVKHLTEAWNGIKKTK